MAFLQGRGVAAEAQVDPLFAAFPEPDQPDAQQRGQSADQAAFGSKGAPGPQLGAALQDSDQRACQAQVAADREAQDRPLEEVPADMQADRKGQLAGEQVAGRQQETGQADIEDRQEVALGLAACSRPKTIEDRVVARRIAVRGWKEFSGEAL